MEDLSDYMSKDFTSSSRHELGHSIIDVGEEYDGGFAYFGVNAAQNLSTPVSWAHWLTNDSSDSTSTTSAAPVARSERAVMPLQDYAWTLLNASTAWSTNFSASGIYSRHLVRFSLSGLPEESDLTVELDGKYLGWKPRKDIGVDRWHYDIYRDGGLADGDHEVKFILHNKDREGTAQMCSVEILEFGNGHEYVNDDSFALLLTLHSSRFNATPGHYSLYPTSVLCSSYGIIPNRQLFSFSLQNKTTYRPTNEDCLMRQVTTPNFCKVCTEGLWVSLLRRVDLIDDLIVECPQNTDANEIKFAVELYLVPLANFRTDSVAPRDSYTIIWTKNGNVLDHFTNNTQLIVGKSDAHATHAVNVTYTTEEVRMDKDGLLSSYQEIIFPDSCMQLGNV
jgi:hypothetical protein